MFRLQQEESAGFFLPTVFLPAEGLGASC